ncbi:MAG: substrate-binding domain-containing protein [Lentisphaeria bacterium]
MIKQSLHRTVREHVLRLVHAARVGDLLPTEKEIAERLKASRSTVQSAMLALQREGFIERQRGRGSFVRSKEQRIFSGTDSSFGGQVLYAYPDHPSIEYILFRQLIEGQARQRQLDTAEARISRYSTYALVKELAGKLPKLKGIIISATPEVMERHNQRMLHALGVPVVVICGEQSIYDNVFSINPDDYKGGYKNIELLAGRGHRRLAYVSNEPKDHGETLILKGMRRALADFGLPSKSLFISPLETKQWEDSRVTAYQATQQLLAGRERPTAVIYHSFAGALAGVRAIRELGLAVPGDISVVANGSPGNDGAYLYPRIAYVTCSREAVVKTALDVIDGSAALPSNNIVVDVTVAEEESVKAI